MTNTFPILHVLQLLICVYCRHIHHMQSSQDIWSLCSIGWSWFDPLRSFLYVVALLHFSPYEVDGVFDWSFLPIWQMLVKRVGWYGYIHPLIGQGFQWCLLYLYQFLSLIVLSLPLYSCVVKDMHWLWTSSSLGDLLMVPTRYPTSCQSLQNSIWPRYGYSRESIECIFW